MSTYLNQPVGEFLDRLAAREPAPGGGAAAAVTAAAAAGLAAMAARFSAPQLDDAANVADDADRLRSQAAPLADEDAEAYRAVLDAYALPKEPDPGSRRERIREALLRAARVPLRITELAAETAQIGARLAAEGNPNLRGDAVSCVVLADAAARAASGLVDINVRLGRLDDEPSGREILERAQRCTAATREAVARVSAAATGAA